MLLLQAAFGLGAHRGRHSLRVGLDGTLDYLRLIGVLDHEADARFGARGRLRVAALRVGRQPTALDGEVTVRVISLSLKVVVASDQIVLGYFVLLGDRWLGL